ncbi:MAG: acetate kinase [Clostridia bacterium]
MKVLVVNAGSSSLKYQLIEMDTEEAICKGNIECIGINGSKLTHKIGAKEFVIEHPIANHTQAFELLMKCLTEGETKVIHDTNDVKAVGHRVVHSGEEFTSSAYIDDDAMEKLEKVSYMAPLHNPAAVNCIKSCMQVFKNTPNVAVFDTAFHSSMPSKASMYAIPYEDYQTYKIRKYGFHGTSHRFVSQEAIKYLTERGLPCGKIVTCHLGNGSSLTAVKDGKCIDTSMGVTPIDGVPMGTRCGSIDPSVVDMLSNYKHMPTGEVLSYLNKKSGFLGVSGRSSDARDICNMAADGDMRAILARDMFAYSCKKFIGSYAAAMNGLDCVVFTGGIGENSAIFRKLILEDMNYLGIELDEEQNKKRGEFINLTAKGSKVQILAIPTNEELVIARDTKEIVENL